MVFVKITGMTGFINENHIKEMISLKLMAQVAKRFTISQQNNLSLNHQFLSCISSRRSCMMKKISNFSPYFIGVNMSSYS